MNRRVFDETLTTLKTSLLKHAIQVIEEKGMTFDVEAYEAQASFQIDDICREMLFFGADLYPVPTPRLITGPIEIAA